jgi:hypothetical protein
MKKTYRVLIGLILVMTVLVLSNPVQADKFTDTIDIYKKSEAVQPFSRRHTGMRFFQQSAKPASALVAPTVRARCTGAGRSPVRHP